MKHKICTKCGILKSLSEFPKDKMGKYEMFISITRCIGDEIKLLPDFNLILKRCFGNEKIIEEFYKCMLLCSNCHREVHEKEKGNEVKEQWNGLSLEFTTNDVVQDKRGDEYEVSIDTTFVMFPSHAIGQRLEVFYKKKGAKYGEFFEIGTAIIEDGKFRIVQW